MNEWLNEWAGIILKPITIKNIVYNMAVEQANHLFLGYDQNVVQEVLVKESTVLLSVGGQQYLWPITAKNT